MTHAKFSLKKGEENPRGRNLKPSAQCLTAVREASRTHTGMSKERDQHKSQERITIQALKAGALVPRELCTQLIAAATSQGKAKHLGQGQWRAVWQKEQQKLAGK